MMSIPQTVAALKEVRKRGAAQFEQASELEQRGLIAATHEHARPFEVTPQGEQVLKAARIKGRLDTLPPIPPYTPPENL